MMQDNDNDRDNDRVGKVVADAYSWMGEDASIDDLRSGFDHMCPEPTGVSIKPDRIGGVPGLWVSAAKSGQPIILHFHAGGYVVGSSLSHRDLAARMARSSEGRVFLADYRRGPENPFPAAHLDGLAVYRGLLAAGERPENIIISGDSAGGGLALSVVVALRDEGAPMPAATVLLSPWADLTLSGASMTNRGEIDPVVSRDTLHEMRQAYLQGADPTDHRASPLLADLFGLPPMLVQVGTREVLEDDAIRISEGVLKSGGEVELQVAYGMVHVYQMFADKLPEAASAIDRIGTFVRLHTAVSESAAL